MKNKENRDKKEYWCSDRQGTKLKRKNMNQQENDVAFVHFSTIKKNVVVAITIITIITNIHLTSNIRVGDMDNRFINHV